MLVAPTGQRPHGAAVQAGAGLRHVLGLLGRHLAAAQVAPPPSPSPSCARSFIACSTGTLSAAAAVFARVNQARASAPCRSHSLACFAARTASHRPLRSTRTRTHMADQGAGGPPPPPPPVTLLPPPPPPGAPSAAPKKSWKNRPAATAGESLAAALASRSSDSGADGAGSGADTVRGSYYYADKSPTGFTGLENQGTMGPHDPSSSTLAHTYTHSISISIAGATCYLNSLLQHLYLIPEFRHALFSWRFEKTDERRSNKDGAEAGAEAEIGASSIPYQLQRLFAQLELTKRKAVNTKALTRSFGWTQNDAFMQQDAQVRFVVSVHMIDRSTNRSN